MRIHKCDVCGIGMGEHRNNTILALGDVCERCESRVQDAAHKLRYEYDRMLLSILERTIADIRREVYEAGHAPV